MSSDTQTVSALVRRSQIICGMTLAYTVVYALVGFALVLFDVIPNGGFMDVTENSGAAVNGALIVAGVLSAAVSFPLKRLLTRRIEPEQPQGHSRFQAARFKITLISMALAEAGGLLGLVAVLVTGGLGAAAILWGIAVGAGVFHFPTRAWLEGEV